MALLCSLVKHCRFSDTLCDCETDCCVTVWIALLYHVRLPQADCMRREETCQGGADPGSDGALTCHRSHHPFQGHHLPSGSLCHCESALTSNLWRAEKDPPWLFLLSLITAIRVWKLDCVVLNVILYKCINVFPRPLVFILFTHERELLYFSPLTTFEPVRLWKIVQYAALKITTWGHKRVWCFGETGSIKDSNTMQFHTLGC